MEWLAQLLVITTLAVIIYVTHRKKRDKTCRPLSPSERLGLYRERMDSAVGLQTEEHAERVAKGIGVKCMRFTFGPKQGITKVKFPTPSKPEPPKPVAVEEHNPKVRAIGSRKR